MKYYCQIFVTLVKYIPTANRKQMRTFLNFVNPDSSSKCGDRLAIITLLDQLRELMPLGASSGDTCKMSVTLWHMMSHTHTAGALFSFIMFHFYRMEENTL